MRFLRERVNSSPLPTTGPGNLGDRGYHLAVSEDEDLERRSMYGITIFVGVTALVFTVVMVCLSWSQPCDRGGATTWHWLQLSYACASPSGGSSSEPNVGVWLGLIISVAAFAWAFAVLRPAIRRDKGDGRA